MSRIQSAVIGTGFMGKVHTEAIRRLGNVEVTAVAGSSAERANAFAIANFIPRSTGDWRDIVADPSISAVHILTPNALHHGMAVAFMNAGKHVLCEKPLAMSQAEAADMLAVAKANHVVHGTNHNLRYYPLVQHIRQMIASDELGDILVVQGTYSQDWLLYDTDYNWRVEEAANGSVRALGDIGSHWMDMIQHLTGLPITALCTDLQTFHKKRKRPRGSVETFSGKKLSPDDYESVDIATDDFGAVLLRLGDRARGAFTVSQVSAGCKNRLQFEIYGTKSGVMWNQESPDTLWIGHRNEPNQVIMKDPSLLLGPAAGFADLPGGHSEGYDDSHKQLFRRFYQCIADRSAAIDYPTFDDGVLGMRLLERCLESHRKGAWIDV